MPVKSKAQFKKFYAMFKRGEITKAQLDKWTKGVKYKALPAKKKKKKVKKTTKRAAVQRAKRKRTRKR